MFENVQSLEPTVGLMPLSFRNTCSENIPNFDFFSRGDRAPPNGSYGSCSGMDQHMFVFNVLAAKAPGLHTP